VEEAGSVPEGFTRIERGGHFLASLGPLYAKKVEHGLVVAMRIEEKHLNTRGIAHGGMLVTLADSALGIAVANHGRERALSEGAPEAPPRSFVTVEAHVGIEKVGARLAFATCFLHVGKRRVLRASGVFATVTPAKPKERFEG